MRAKDILLRGHQAACREIGETILDEWDWSWTIITYEAALAFERLADEVRADIHVGAEARK